MPLHFLRAIPILVLLLAATTVLPTTAATHGCDGDVLVDTPAVGVGRVTGDCTGAFVVVHSDGCMMVEWGVHEGPVGLGGANSCAAAAYVRAGTPLLP